MKKLVVFGAGQFAEMASYCFTHDTELQAVAHTVDGAYIRESTVGGLPVVPFEDLASAFPPSDHALFVAVGPHQVNRVRAERCAAAREKGYRLATYVSSKARVWDDLIIGDNSFVDSCTDVQPLVRIGHGVIVLGGRVAHHCRLDDHSFISGATLGGGVHVGARSFIGMQATVREQISIGAANVIGAGSLILKNTRDGEVYAQRGTPLSGIPSHRIRLV